MSNQLEKLSRLIQQAAAALAKATSAAEILDASDHAKVAYDAAKLAARLGKMKDAHGAVVAACRRVMADALVIETQAQVRLASEYDAAQQRGEVRKDGQRRPHKEAIPNENTLSSVTDIGLTSKQVHEARQVRDAEKQSPGIVRKTVDAKVKAGEEPTRADVRRAVQKTKPKSATPKSRVQTAPQAVKREERVAELLDAGKNSREIADELGVGVRAAAQAIEHVKIRREAEPLIDPSTLSLSQQQKNDMWRRQWTRQEKLRLSAEFDRMVETAVHRRLDDIILPQWKEQIEEAKLIYRNRKGVMNKVTLNKIKKPLHEDTLRFLERYIPKKDYDDLLKKSTEALLILNKYEKLLLSEQDSPTIICDVPSTIAEWDALKAKATAERKAKRNSGVNVSVRH